MQTISTGRRLFLVLVGVMTSVLVGTTFLYLFGGLSFMLTERIYRMIFDLLPTMVLVGGVVGWAAVPMGANTSRLVVIGAAIGFIAGLFVGVMVSQAFSLSGNSVVIAVTVCGMIVGVLMLGVGGRKRAR